MTDLGTLGGTQSFAFSINDAGQVVGYIDFPSISGTIIRHAFLYSGGTITDLGTLSGTQSIAYAINNSAQVVGVSSATGHSFLYSNGQMTDLGPVNATAINDSAQVTGWYNDISAGGRDRAFLYSNGRMTDLGTLGGIYSAAYGINNSGQVVGYSATATGQADAFLYSNGQMKDLGTLGGTYSSASGLNNSGQVVGTSLTAGGQSHAFLYSGGNMTDLNDLVAVGSGVYLAGALAINDSGQIVAYGSDNHSYLLTPFSFDIPVPTAFPSSSCVGTICLSSWGTLQDLYRRTLYTAAGLPANGSPDPTTGQPGTSTVYATAAIGNPNPPACSPFFESPVPTAPLLTAPDSFVNIISGAPSCGYGSANSSMYGRAEFTGLHALASTNAQAFPVRNGNNLLGFTSYGVASSADLLFFQPSAGTLPFPNPVPTPQSFQLTNRVARFTFSVHGSLRTLEAAPHAAAGFYFASAGGTCPTLTCDFQQFPWQWGSFVSLDDSGAPHTITRDIPYVDGQPLLTAFLLAAATQVSGRLDTAESTYNGDIIADLASTATLVKVQVFEGTPDNLGQEITDFKILSGSGTPYTKDGVPKGVTVTLASTQLVYPGATNVVVAVDAANQGTATGTVDIYDGATKLTTAYLQGDGKAYWYISPGLAAGTHQISATYSGDSKHPAGSSAPVTIAVNPVPVNFGVACWSADPQSYQCTVNVSSNAGAALGSINYTLDSGTAVSLPLSYGNAQFKVVPGPGSHSLVIQYPPQGDFAVSQPITKTFATH